MAVAQVAECRSRHRADDLERRYVDFQATFFSEDQPKD